MSEPFPSSNPEFDLIGYCEHIMPDGRRCRHSAQIDRAAMLVRFGDMPMSEFAGDLPPSGPSIIMRALGVDS